MSIINRVVYLLLVATSIPFCAENRSDPVFYLNTGTSKALSPNEFKSTHRSGYALGAAIGKYMSSRFQMQISVEYYNMPLDNARYISYHDYPQAETFVEGGDLGSFMALASIKYEYLQSQNSRARAYWRASTGYVRNNQKSITANISSEEGEVSDISEPSNRESALCAGLGLGLDLLMSKSANVYFELGCRAGFFAHQTTIIFPIIFGISINSY